MQLTYFGHSCFMVESDGHRILFDPFIADNPLASGVDVDQIRCDYMLISHAHSDHIADVERIAANNPDVIIVGIWEVSAYFSAKGLKTHPMNKGGWWSFDFGRVKMVQAVHSSAFPDGTYGGEPVGYVLDMADGVLYFAGDTALTLDMQIIPMTCPPLSTAILPLGSNFTMDYEDACIAAQFLNCRRIVGCHYDTFGYIKLDHEAAKEKFAAHNRSLILPAIGETFTLQ